MAHESFYKSVLLLSLVILLHAAYSTAEWRNFFRKQQQSPPNPDQSPLAAFLAQLGSMGNVPMDIAIQTLVGLGLAMLAVLNIGGEFKVGFDSSFFFFYIYINICCFFFLVD